MVTKTFIITVISPSNVVTHSQKLWNI